MFAKLYRNLGINVDSTRLIDIAGRPQFLTERESVPGGLGVPSLLQVESKTPKGGVTCDALGSFC